MCIRDRYNAEYGAEPRYIEVGSLDRKGRGASTFLKELVAAVDYNKSLTIENDQWPVRYKRGLLNVSVGKYETKTMWVEIGGLFFSFFEKPELPKPSQSLHLGRIEVMLEHYDERHPDRIVLKPTSKDSNAKTWVTLSGIHISSLKAESELNRLEWVVALCGNQERLRKDTYYDVDPEVIRVKRGHVKYQGRKLWGELDELTFRLLLRPKSLLFTKVILLQNVSGITANRNILTIKTLNGSEFKLSMESIASEWKSAMENNIAVLRQIKAGNQVSVSSMVAQSLNLDNKAGKKRTTTKPDENSTKAISSGEIPYDEIKLLDKLGDGCFGEVYKGVCRSKDVAVKIPLVQSLDDTQLEMLRKEIEIMSSNPHPNIVQFMGACTQPGHFRIVTELLNGDLDSLLKRTDQRFSLFERMKMAKDAALGMVWLHQSTPQIIHRDLKTANLLYSKTGTPDRATYTVKVCDFGLSAIKQDTLEALRDSGGAKGTPLYMAPEVMLQEGFDEKADVYSFGIVLWEIVSRKDPYPHHTDYQTFVKAIVEDGERPKIPQDTPSLLRTLIERCWDAYPEYRPDFQEITIVLDEIIVECAISDVEGRKFWKKNFLKKFSVPWTDFLPAFYSFLGIRVPDTFYAKGNTPSALSGDDDIALACLRILLVEENPSESGRVRIETFNDVVNWFGPLKPKTGNFVKRVTDVLSQSWFHGSISNQVAQQLLSKEEPVY
eukprot:TRINITY_DN413_c0_g1_i1.p1 TRINITY_DN413_c0_g1~~TRINITY_DN413_c0_g1_i1.p1  ORF type:complete len:719 (-),score=115.94 TRINITY_DN413_c0_g1_i1:68-2224(-)